MPEAIFCKYHQQTPARWHCVNCATDVCNSCVNDYISDTSPRCAVCNEQLEDVGQEAMIPPFWHKTPLFFKIPLSISAITVMLAIIFFSYIALQIPIIGWLVLAIVMPVVFLKYAYMTLQNVSAGNLNAPNLGEIFSDNDYAIVFKQVAISIILLAPTTEILAFNGTLGLLWYFLVLFLMPATVMVLSVEQRFFSAVNPILLLSFVQRIGFSYLGLYVLLVIVSGGPTIIIEAVLATGELSLFVLVLYVILEMYFTLVVFSIMGYVLLKYHHRLGYQIDVSAEELFGNYHPAPNVHPMLKDIEVLIKENQPKLAWQKLQGRIEENPGDFTLKIRLHKLLLMNRRFEQMLRDAPRLIHALLNGNDKAQAVDIYRDCLQAKADFTLPRAQLHLPLAEIMLQMGQFKLISHLLNRYHERFPADDKIAETYFVLAKSLSEGLGEDKKALSVLNFIEKIAPEGPVKEQVNEYQNMIRQLNKS
jgi:hypothetical protein